jgi:hypothetical protein
MMVRLETEEGPVAPNLQLGALSPHLHGREVLTYHRAGRLWSAISKELTYCCGLDDRIQAIRATPDGIQRRWLSREGARALEEDLADRLRELLRALSAPSIRRITPPPGSEDRSRILEAFRQGAAMDFEAMEADAQRFAGVCALSGSSPRIRISPSLCMRRPGNQGLPVQHLPLLRVLPVGAPAGPIP